MAFPWARSCPFLSPPSFFVFSLAVGVLLGPGAGGASTRGALTPPSPFLDVLLLSDMWLIAIQLYIEIHILVREILRLFSLDPLSLGEDTLLVCSMLIIYHFGSPLIRPESCPYTWEIIGESYVLLTPLAPYELIE
jgi:hypothetical protein